MRIDIIKKALDIESDLRKVQLAIHAYHDKRNALIKIREDLKLDIGLYNLWGTNDTYIKVGKKLIKVRVTSDGSFYSEEIKVKTLIP